jgi:D-aminopeptidase
MNSHVRGVLAAALAVAVAVAAPAADRPRARDLGVAPGVFPPGPLNAITDVGGVRVGHLTLVEGDRVRTGLTVVLPHGGNLFREKVPGAVFVGNGFGKLAGSTQVEELGTIETAIGLTNTLSVGAVMQGLVAAALAQPGNEDVRSVNALVGETNDGRLNDIRGRHVRADHVRAALHSASGGAVAEGNVGAGTGTVCFGWKCGIGTASRRLPEPLGGYTLGVLVQANFGGILTVDGVPVGKEMDAAGERRARARTTHAADADGSCMIVVATDAPPGGAGGVRPGAHGRRLQQRQRRLRDRLLDRTRAARAPRRSHGAGAAAASSGRRVVAVPGRAGDDGGGRLQRAAEVGDDHRR